MKLLKRLLKILVGLCLVSFLIFGVLYSIYNKPLPQGRVGPKADALAEKMLRALNDDAYRNTRFLEWSYARNTHHYIWDKKRGRVQVKWDDYVVDLDLSDPSRSAVAQGGHSLSAKESKEIHTKAWDYFNNDSFWLVAPFKVFDPGVRRSIVLLEDGSEGLLVTYTQGGSTPGDSYLWKLNANGFPQSFQMWVRIIPIGGIEASWDNWKVHTSGVFLPGSHELGPFTLSMGEVKAYP